MSAGARVLAVDDDPGLRKLMAHTLTRAGFSVSVAGDGAEAMRALQAGAFDVVVSDVQMPALDGFGLLDAARIDPRLAGLPFVLVTAFTERSALRRGMRLGADDFLGKPVRPQALLEAVQGALDKRRRLRSMVSAHAMAEPDELKARYEASCAEEPSIPAPGRSAGKGLAGRVVTQTVLFSDIRGFTAMAERLTASDVAELLARFLHEVCAPVFEERGRVMKVMGDGLMAVFGQDAPGDIAGHAAAGLRAAQRILRVTREFRKWVEGRFSLPGLPPFDVGVGVHTGEVMMFRPPLHGSDDLTAVGDTVNVAARLEAMSKALRWPVVASLHTLGLAGAGFRCAEQRALVLAGRDRPIGVGRLLEIAPVRPARLTLPLTQGAQAVLGESARASADAVKAASNRRRTAARRASDQEVPGYRLVRKLGEGKTSSVYLAVHRAQKREVILEVPRSVAHEPCAVQNALSR